jgi:hypothetical protein
MAKGDIKIVFTEDFAVHKKDSEVTFSRDLAHICLGKKVAKRWVESIKPKKPNKRK